MTPIQFLVCLILLSMVLFGCEKKLTQKRLPEPTSKLKSGEIMREKTKINSVYDNVENEQLPRIVPFNDEQQKYIIELVSAMLRVIKGTSDLELEENKTFGMGKYFWPKDPTKPTKTLRYYTYDNFQVRGIKLSFERKDERSNWQRAGLGVHPRNFPTGVYDMRLPPSVFQEFQLVKSVQETRPEESIYKPIVFYFSHKVIPGLTLKVEVRSDLTSLSEPYPRTFHGIEIARSSKP